MEDLEKNVMLEITLKEYLEFRKSLEFRDRVFNLKEKDKWEIAGELMNIIEFMYGIKDEEQISRDI